MDAVVNFCCCMLVLFSTVTLAGRRGISHHELDVTKQYLSNLNKPAVNSIKSPDGDIIDCVHISHQPAFENPLLKNHTIQMTPNCNPQGIYSQGNVCSRLGTESKPVTQFWHLNGRCPEGTIPVRRTTKEDVMRARSQIYGKKKLQSVPKPESADPHQVTQSVHQHAVVYVEGDEYYGAKAGINVWKPQIQQPNEFSSSQIWILGGSFGEDLNSIEAGWQVSPDLYGDNNTRLFTYWTKDSYQGTGCYNLLCSGFIQISNEIAMGASILPISNYGASQYDITILVWKDPKEGNWWMQFGDDHLVGYWPGFLFSYLTDSASMIQWGGEVVNSEANGEHTSTQMGSGHFPDAGFGKASYFRNIQIVDGSNNLKAPQDLSTFTEQPNCYDVQMRKGSDWGNYFYYGGPGRNNNCIIAKGPKSLPIDTTFKLPSPLPKWPEGGEFAKGTIDLGGLEVSQISTFNIVWATYEGGVDNNGATFYEPSVIPEGFFMFGCYSQPNNRALHGWVLVGKDISNDSLERPLDYTLVWSTESLKTKQDGIGHVWLPVPPDGYKALGHVVTNSPKKPSLDRIRCVRADLTEQCETEAWIWGPEEQANSSSINVYAMRPSNRSIEARGISVGTFAAVNGATSSISLACLKNTKSLSSPMPSISQVEALFESYSPWIYIHPDDEYLPSSVEWFFTNGALLYKKGEETKPVHIDAMGSNLPQGGSSDGEYWLDLPVDEAAKEKVKKGDIVSCKSYLHVKPMLGATFTDIAVWIFYPFNGPARAKVTLITVPLGEIGEHVGDWEHVTFRVSNFNGELCSVYFSQHGGGEWVDASQLEFQDGNKVVTYASLHGHAFYPNPGMVLQGTDSVGLRNDRAKSTKVINCGQNFALVAAEYLGTAFTEPYWLNYSRKWGPNITYDIARTINHVEKQLPGTLKSAFQKFINVLPDEILGEEGPTGPKTKKSWSGDED